MKYKEKPVGGSVMFDCQFPRTNQSLFYSHKKGKGLDEMSPNSRLVTIPRAGLYELLDLKIDDSGFYYCGESDLLMNLVVRGIFSLLIYLWCSCYCICHLYWSANCMTELLILPCPQLSSVDVSTENSFGFPSTENSFSFT